MAALQVSYAIGVAQPLSVHVDTYGTGAIPDKEILQAVLKNFDFRPGDPSHHDSAAISRSTYNMMLWLITPIMCSVHSFESAPDVACCSHRSWGDHERAWRACNM